MACKKLKPIEERDPQAARILEAFDRLHQLNQPEEIKPMRPALQLVGECKAAPKSKQGGWGAPDFTGIVVFLVTVGVLIGIAITIVLPWLWATVKPFIHAVTA